MVSDVAVNPLPEVYTLCGEGGGIRTRVSFLKNTYIYSIPVVGSQYMYCRARTAAAESLKSQISSQSKQATVRRNAKMKKSFRKRNLKSKRTFSARGSNFRSIE
jgi:hypothetical protein